VLVPAGGEDAARDVLGTRAAPAGARAAPRPRRPAPTWVRVLALVLTGLVVLFVAAGVISAIVG